MALHGGNGGHISLRQMFERLAESNERIGELLEANNEKLDTQSEKLDALAGILTDRIDDIHKATTKTLPTAQIRNVRRTVRMIRRVVGRRVMLILGAGVLIGSALGTSGGELLRSLLVTLAR